MHQSKNKTDAEHQSSLNSALYDIQSSLKNLELNQTKIAEHNIEIKHINVGLERLHSCVDRVLDEIKKMDSRVGRMEMVLENKINLRPRDFIRFNIVEVVREYWQVIALTLSVGSFFMAYAFGIKIKD